jgi:hypothetical protein
LVLLVIVCWQTHYNIENLEAHPFCIKNLLLQEPQMIDEFHAALCLPEMMNSPSCGVLQEILLSVPFFYQNFSTNLTP